MKKILIYLISGILIACSDAGSTVNYTILKEKEAVIETGNSIVIIEIGLDEEIDEEKLKKIALEIKKERPGKEHFWISYYLESEEDKNKVWAITNFNPELIIDIYGENESVSNEIDMKESDIPDDNNTSLTEELKFDSLLIIAGKSLGDIELGMSKEEVRDIMSYKGDISGDFWSFDTENYEKLLRILFIENKVSKISFSYPEFKTAEGYSVENHRNNAEHFIIYENEDEYLPPSGKKIVNLMYILKSGGLAFIDYDINDAEPEQRDLLYWGIIYEGDLPEYELNHEWKKQGEIADDEYGG